MQHYNLQNYLTILSIHYLALFPILPILNNISKWKSIHGVVIKSKHPNNQIKMIYRLVFELKLL
jgi:hypothetical protein